MRRVVLARLLPALALGAPLAACAPSRATPTTPAPIVHPRAARLDSIVRAFHAAGRFDGAVLVAEAGHVLLETGVGEANREWHVPNAPDVRYRIASTTKQFTAALVLKLVEEGRLRLDGRVREYLPDYPAPQGDRVTLHHLLSHSSGIPNYVAVPGFYAGVARLEKSPAELVALFSAQPLAFAPGAKWDYSNSNYVLLGAIIEKVTGQDYAVALRVRLLAPLGLADTDYDASDRIVERRAAGYVRDGDRVFNAPHLDSSIPYAAGMLRSSVRDLYRWATALEDGRVFRDTATLARMIAPHVETGIPLGHYGYGVFTGEQVLGGRRVRVIQHGGMIPGFTAGFWRMPAERRVVVVLANSMPAAVPELAEALANALYAAP